MADQLPASDGPLPPGKAHTLPLRLARTICLLAGGIALPTSAWVVFMRWYGGHAWADEAAFAAAVLWLVTAVATAAWVLTRARYDLAFAQELPAAASTTDTAGLFGRSHQDERAHLIDAHAERLRQLSGLPQVLVSLPALALAVATLIVGWPAPSDASGGTTPALLLLVIAFGLLVAERLVAIEDAWRDSERLGATLRAAIVVLAASGICTLVGGLGVVEVTWAQRLLSLLVLVLLAEMLLRAPLAILRGANQDVTVWCTGTVLSQLGRLLAHRATKQRPPLIDVSRSWAVRFVRRALAPTLVGVVVAGWLATSVTVLDVGSRALLQRLGDAPRVLAPGLHIHLPWPFVQVRRLDFGQVHQTALADETDKARTATSPAAPIAVLSAEGDPPETADRLWERAHPSESTFLLPAPLQPGRGQALHLVNSDTRVFWRIGLTDDQAIAAGTRVGEADALVRRLSAQALIEVFQERGLDQVLASDRARLAGVVRTTVQRALDNLGSGIEVVGLVVDALHPPTAAAGAYHYVQAASISAASDILAAEAAARRGEHEAQQSASVRLREAEAAAAEQHARAVSERVRFQADASTAANAGAVLELERWLQGLTNTLGRSPLVIIDHRIPREQLPFLDYRASPTGGTSATDAAPPARKTP